MLYLMLEQFDIKLFYSINHLPHPAILDYLAIFVHRATYAGVIYILLLLILLWFKKHRRLVWLGFSSALITYCVTDLILKPLIGRERPFQALMDAVAVSPLPHSASLPSGQTASTAAIVMICILVLRHRSKYFLWFWLAIVGLDRIYMGHHYPSDVLAGAIIGVAIAYCVWATAKHKNWIAPLL